MPEQNNHNRDQDVKIAEIQKDVSWIKKELGQIKNQVSNHLPTEIKELNDKFNSFQISQSRWIIGILVTLGINLILVVVGLIIQ
jgi:hypothetical protein